MSAPVTPLHASCRSNACRQLPLVPPFMPPLVVSLCLGAQAAHSQSLADGGDPGRTGPAALPTVALSIESIVPLSRPSPGSSSIERPDAASWSPAGRVDNSRLQWRTWLGGGRTSLGLGANVDAWAVQAPAGAPLSSAIGSGVGAPVWALGLRYRFSNQATAYADALRPSAGADGEPVQTRLVMEWKTASDNRLGALRQGAFSMQLDSGYKLSLRPRGRGLALQLRGQF